MPRSAQPRKIRDAARIVENSVLAFELNRQLIAACEHNRRERAPPKVQRGFTTAPAALLDALKRGAIEGNAERLPKTPAQFGKQLRALIRPIKEYSGLSIEPTTRAGRTVYRVRYPTLL